jgi:hypothetical protein
MTKAILWNAPPSQSTECMFGWNLSSSGRMRRGPLRGAQIPQNLYIDHPGPGRDIGKSATHSWLGARGAKLRLTRSGGRVAAGSALVVRTLLPRRAPRNPSWPMSRSTVQRATGMPLRLSSSQTFPGAVDAVVVPVDVRDLLLELLIAAILGSGGTSPSVVVGRWGNRRAVLETAPWESTRHPIAGHRPRDGPCAGR